ncbi:MAG: hypothetical protein ACRDVP_05420 [Acidimicrobiales bacterium]
MSSPGETENDLLVRSRSALLDALQALYAHLDAVVVVGAQAIYLRTSSAPVALAETTKDSDFALDPRLLRSDPLIEKAMRDAKFLPNLESGQPGAWVNAEGIPVDLMVPEKLAGGGKSARGARIPPHDRRSMRRARGLEAAIVDNDLMEIRALDASDTRRIESRVAGPAALLIAKLHKLAERAATSPDRLLDKDAHDVYRLLIDTDTQALATTFHGLLHEDLCSEVAEEAKTQLRVLFSDGPVATGSEMAGRAEAGVGEPETVARQVAILADDLLKAIDVLE